jgi:hypothetical protein
MRLANIRSSTTENCWQRDMIGILLCTIDCWELQNYGSLKAKPRCWRVIELVTAQSF